MLCCFVLLRYFVSYVELFFVVLLLSFCCLDSLFYFVLVSCFLSFCCVDFALFCCFV